MSDYDFPYDWNEEKYQAELRKQGVPTEDTPTPQGGLEQPKGGVEPKDTKSLTLVSTWRGKKLDDYSKAELIEIVCELGQAQQQESYEHSRQLDVLNDLVQKGFKR